MTPRRPPMLATWVLERFCADPGLAGDLIEEYGHRQSTRWSWKQAIMAIGAYSTSQILEHKWLAVRAIVTGFVIWYVFNATLLRGFVRPWLAPDTTMEKAVYLTLGYALWLANGWTIAKLHRPVLDGDGGRVRVVVDCRVGAACVRGRRQHAHGIDRRRFPCVGTAHAARRHRDAHHWRCAGRVPRSSQTNPFSRSGLGTRIASRIRRSLIAGR